MLETYLVAAAVAATAQLHAVAFEGCVAVASGSPVHGHVMLVQCQQRLDNRRGDGCARHRRFKDGRGGRVEHIRAALAKRQLKAELNGEGNFDSHTRSAKSKAGILAF